MSAYSATPGWTLSPPNHAAALHLTRRGRLARTVALLSGVVLLLLMVLDTLGGQPVLADEAGSVTAVTTQRVVVDSGDSLWAIATSVAPDIDPRETIHAIRELNGLRTSNLQPGQVLLIPTAP